MKIIYSLSFAFLFSFSVVFSQTNISRDTLTVLGHQDTLILQGKIKVKNPCSVDVKTKVRRREITKLKNTKNHFCWTQCYENSVDSTPTPLTIPSMGETDKFISDYEPYNGSGETIITYIFYNSQNKLDSTWITIKFLSSDTVTTGTIMSPASPYISLDFTAGLSKHKSNNNSFYPNPAKESLTIESEINRNAEFFITDALGKEVYHNKLDRNGKYKLDLYTWKEGIYFYRIEGDEPVVSKFTIIKD